MHLEDYFDFLAPDVRIKGSRIGIETVLYGFIHRARTAEEIACELPPASDGSPFPPRQARGLRPRRTLPARV
jgi:hypothetical protein